MNIFGFFATAIFAAESLLTPLSDAVNKPAVSFADLMKTASAGTGTFSATIVAGQTVEVDMRKTKKPHNTIAFLGDSMIDTLGQDLGLVQDELRRVYPMTIFTLLNYGVGGENIVSGLERVTRETTYLGQWRPSLISTNPSVYGVKFFLKKLLQNVNKRETAVRVVHIPTNLSAQSDNERSQAQNKEKAMQILYGKIYKALLHLHTTGLILMQSSRNIKMQDLTRCSY